MSANDVILNIGAANPYDVIVWVDYPPVPPDTGFTGKSSGTGRRRRKRFVIPAGPNRREEEEIALIVGAWLNVTN